MDKFRNKYRIPPARLKNWDYGWNASYFVTLCTANRECFFGNVMDDRMELSVIGKMANKYLLEIPRRYKYAKLDEFIVMPNHVHAIIIIEKMDDGRVDGIGGRDAINRVSTNTNTEYQTDPPADQNIQQNPKKRGGITGNKNPMLHDNISRVLNWYTGRVTFESRKIHAGFAWQSRFYDHIIRNNTEYQRIKNYIINNPKNWDKDKLHND